MNQVFKLFIALGLFASSFFAHAQATQEAMQSDDNFDDIIMEGEGLTLEQTANPEKEAVSGVSVVMDKEQIKTTSQIGLVEDVMSSVQTMPGVTFNGNWNSEPSIRGGYPREMQTVLDGVYILYPWHWGGAYSIFNPHMTDSVKMSNGIFSARYGQALSGLMEVTTGQTGEEIHFDFNRTSISTDLFIQLPVTNNFGVFAGGKITYIEGYIGAYKMFGGSNEITDALKTVPYIRDFYTKIYWNPAEKLNLTFNAFYGSDGVGLETDDTDDGEHTTSDFDFSMQTAFAALNAKWIPSDNTQVKALASYNWTFENLTYSGTVDGEFKYNDDFLEQYGSLLSDEARASKKYHLNTQNESQKERIIAHQIQGKIEGEMELNASNRIALGAEEMWSRSDTTQKMHGWNEQLKKDSPYPDFYEIDYSIKEKGNNVFKSAAYVLWNFGTETSVFSGETGLRIDELNIRNYNADLSLDAKPVFNPRAVLHCTPWRYTDYFDKVSFSAGCGLFSSVPMELIVASKDMGLKESDVSPNRAIFTVLGTELKFNEDWNFKLEGYYKHYLNRMFTVEDDTDPMDIKLDSRFNGKGFTTGFDLMLEKKNGEKWDGYLSYSFVMAKFKNPYTKLYDDQTTNYGDPLDEWYYPDFHRFHTLNAVANFKFKEHWTFTVKGTFATGTPKKDSSSIYCYPAKLEDGTVIQRYTRNSFYSDSLRTQISCPIDIRLGYKKKVGKSSRTTLEYYIGAEDIFLNLYSPKGEKGFNSRTGKEDDNTSSANFNIGIPMISLGLKISY